MKIIIIFLVFVACRQAPETIGYIKPDTVVVQDSIKIELLEGQISLLQEKNITHQILNDSLKTKLFISDYKLERVRYYLNICLRNPSQDKFLKGWIRRAIE